MYLVRKQMTNLEVCPQDTHTHTHTRTHSERDRQTDTDSHIPRAFLFPFSLCSFIHFVIQKSYSVSRAFFKAHPVVNNKVSDYSLNLLYNIFYQFLICS